MSMLGSPWYLIQFTFDHVDAVEALAICTSFVLIGLAWTIPGDENAFLICGTLRSHAKNDVAF